MMNTKHTILMKALHVAFFFIVATAWMPAWSRPIKYYLCNFKVTSSIQPNYHNEAVWFVFRKFDANKNNKFESSEIEDFKSAIAKASGEDKVLNAKEAKLLAQKLGIQVSDLYNAIKHLAADVLANNLYQAFNDSFFNSVGPKSRNKLLSCINKDNIIEVFLQYSDFMDEHYQTTTLSLHDDIVANYCIYKNTHSKAQDIFSRWLVLLSEATKDRKINIDSTLKRAEKIVARGNKKEMAHIFEVILRLLEQYELQK